MEGAPCVYGERVYAERGCMQRGVVCREGVYAERGRIQGVMGGVCIWCVFLLCVVYVACIQHDALCM